MWMMVFLAVVVAAYGYIIVLSLWARRVQRAAAGFPHHPRDHSAITHAVERSVHGFIAGWLIVSLAVRVLQLTLDITSWLIVPLTLFVALPTARVLGVVRRMAVEDLHNWNIRLLNKLKTTVLLACSTGLLVDQVWRVVTLFWF